MIAVNPPLRTMRMSREPLLSVTTTLIFQLGELIFTSFACMAIAVAIANASNRDFFI